MSKKYLKNFSLLISLLFLLTPFISQAAGISNTISSLENTAQQTGLSSVSNLDASIGTILKNIFSFLGIIFLILIIYAGFLWMTAGGNDQQIAKGKNIMLWAIIGIFIILSAYGITIAVFNLFK